MFPDIAERLDATKLRYVLYARKSTDDPKKQVRSIEDQVAECKLFAVRNGLTVVGEPVTEKKSAKIPDQRPAFNQILVDIRAGKYDGILSWHPDRLARNMKEAGVIIEMLDEGVIKDLKFVTHYFSNDPSGKLLLGILFTLSKHYSDKLSVDATRGTRARLAEGKTPTPKYGYINEEGIYRPDPDNFDLVCQAWQMRKSGTSIEEICKLLNQKGFHRTVKATGKKLYMTKQKLSDFFRDPFYYGLLIQAGQSVDLRQIYNFEPAVSEEDYNLVQQLNHRWRFKPTKAHGTTFYPLRLMVLCSFCNHSMRVGPSRSSKGKQYLYFRCDNNECLRQKRSIRSKVIFDFVYEFLAGGFNFTEKEYHDYYNGLVELSDIKREKLKIELHSKQAILNRIKTEINEISNGLLKFGVSPRVKSEGEASIARLEPQQFELEEEIKQIKAKLPDPDKTKLSLEQFLNLSENAASKLKAGNAIAKDAICRLVFLNLTADEKNVASYQLKEPFATLLKERKIRVSGPAEN